MMFLLSNGCIFLSLPWSMQRSLMPSRSSCKKTASEHASLGAAPNICCRACLCVPVVGMRIQASRLVRAGANIIHAPTPIIAAPALMPTASVGYGKARNKQLRTDLLDEAILGEVCQLLSHPERLEQEYRRRLVQEEKPPDELSALEARIGRLRQGISRLIDSYAEGLIDKGEFEPRMARMRERLKQIETQAQQVKDEASLERELTLILGRLDEFAARVKTGLHEADWLTRREIIRALVKRVEIDQEQVRVIFRVNPPPAPQPPSEKDSQSLQHCGRRDLPAAG
jgi:hypothetical protein